MLRSCPNPSAPPITTPPSGVVATGSSLYDDRRISPAEAFLLLRYREELSGRVLELGPGAGRFTGYLAELATELTALELSPDMAEVCRRRVPSATVKVGDMEDLSGFATASLDAVVGTCNVLGVLDDPERRAMLKELHRVLGPAACSCSRRITATLTCGSVPGS